MRRGFEVVHPEAFLEQVAARPGLSSNGPLLVCEHGRLIGVLGPDEIVAWRGRGGRGARRERVRDIMPSDVLYCLESTDIEEAIALMRESRAGWLPVLGADRRLAGLLALADVQASGKASPAAAHGARPRAAG